MQKLLKKPLFKKGFTIIELIVIMATVAILVFLGSLAYNGYTIQAKSTRLQYDARLLSDACERYYVANGEYPLLSDTPFTADQVNAFSDKVLNSKGDVVTLDSSGSYYDIDFDKLKKFVSVKEDYKNFILQNPIGEVFTFNPKKNIRLPENRDLASKPTAVITMSPEANVNTGTVITWAYNNSTDGHFNIINAEWQGKQDTYSTQGSYTVKLRVENQLGIWSDWTEKTFTVNPLFTGLTLNYTGSVQTWTVPTTGIYKMEVWGASSGGKGGYAVGNVALTANQTVYIYVGGSNGYNQSSSGGGNSGDGDVGGGGTDIRTNGQALTNRLIAAGGGGGGTYYTIGYSHHSKGGDGGGITGIKGDDAYVSGYTAIGGAGGAAGGNKGGNGSIASPPATSGMAFSGGGGGSAYLGGVQNGTITTGVNVGDGKAVISLAN